MIIFQAVSIGFGAEKKKKILALNEKVILIFFKGLFYLISVVNYHVML